MLKAAAEAAGISLNQYCVRVLATPGGGIVGHPDAARAVAKAAGLFGSDVQAVVVYGSWVRGEPTRRARATHARRSRS